MRWLMDKIVPDEALCLRATFADRWQAFMWAHHSQLMSLGRAIFPAITTFGRAAAEAALQHEHRAWQRRAWSSYDAIGEV